jgi:hypothetical protein
MDINWVIYPGHVNQWNIAVGLSPEKDSVAVGDWN